MSKKNTAPPPRPPAPKSVGGMSFSFKALEEGDDEDEELTILEGKFDKQINNEKEKQIRETDRERSYSKSPVERLQSVSEEKPLKRSQNSFEKIKDLSGKLQESFSKKIEEFSDPPGKSEPIKIKQQTKSFNGDFESSLDKIEAKADGTSNDVDNSSSLSNETQYFELSTESEKADEIKTDENDDLNMVDEYYNIENGENFADLPGVVPMVRQRKKFHFMKSKPVVPPAPVSMSKLSKDLKEDSVETLKSVKEAGRTNNSDSVANSITDSITNNIAVIAKDKLTAVVSIGGSNISIWKIIGAASLIILYMILPLPSYINGFVAGLFLSSAGWSLYLWVIKPPKPREPIPDLPLDKLPPMPAPEMKEAKGEDGCYKGWMNEIMNYTPDTYSINQTHSIFVHLEGTTMRLRRPKVNIPKRAMWNEPSSSVPQFVHQRHFDITGSRVLLLPPELVKKRLWSKKYPICICLAKDGKKVNFTQPGSHGYMMAHSNSYPKMSQSILPEDSGTSHGFEVVNEQKCDSSLLFLFARTCHEKEQWYRRFEAAARGVPLPNHILEVQRILNTSTARHRRSSSSDSLNRHKRQESTDSTSSASSPTTELESLPGEVTLKDFVMYMSRLIPKATGSESVPSSPAHTATGKDKSSELKASIPRGIICDPVLTPLNALLGRCFWDFLRDDYWADVVKEKLQKKLSKIHIPYFIEELQISNIDLGSEIPVIRRANKPYLDENGFWVDLDVTYSGKFKMTIETKVNLLKLKKPVSVQTSVEKEESERSAVTDSNEEDSAESSTEDEDEVPSQGEEGSSGGGRGKTWMKYINKITASKYFQSATENKYIKKAMTEVSNTRLILTVEMQKLNGTLAINIPPPPTDRLWYGFRGNPQLWLVAKPKVGERAVTVSHITDWIEKKLSLEFQHVFVMPNMDDLVIPILLPGNTQLSEASIPRSDSGSPV